MDKIILPDVEGNIENEALRIVKVEEPNVEKLEFVEIQYDYLGEKDRDPGEECWVGHVVFEGKTIFEYRGPNARVGFVDVYIEFTYTERDELTFGEIHVEETDSWWE